jgi:hypothetical protein
MILRGIKKETRDGIKRGEGTGRLSRGGGTERSMLKALVLILGREPLELIVSVILAIRI